VGESHQTDLPEGENETWIGPVRNEVVLEEQENLAAQVHPVQPQPLQVYHQVCVVATTDKQAA